MSKEKQNQNHRWFAKLEFRNETLRLHDGKEVVEWQGQEWTGIGKVLLGGFRLERAIAGNIPRNRLGITVRVQDAWKHIVRKRYMNRKLTISGCLIGTENTIEEKVKEVAVIRSWRLNLRPIGITFEGISQLEAAIAKDYPYNWAGEAEEYPKMPHPEAKRWIRIRRKVLNWIEAEEAHRRPQYWSHVDQQERHPGDYGFSHAKKANSPRYRWRTEQRFITQMKPGPTPMEVWWAELKYQTKSLIHPEWWWAMRTRKGKKILTKILRWIAGQAW